MGAGPLPPETPWKIEARREKKGKKKEEEERGGWRKKKGNKLPKGQIVDPPLSIHVLMT